MRQSVHDEYRQAAELHWWFRARRAIFARLLDAGHALPSSADILDVGPGSGVNLPVLRGRGRVVVLDADLGSLAACRTAGADAVVFGDAQATPFADGSFDLITALDVLEHLDDDRGALAEMRRMLRPSGRLLVSVPAFGLLWGRQDVLSHHRRRYTRGELARKLRDVGFSIDRLSYFNTLLFPPILALRLAMRPFLSGTVGRGASDLAVRLPFGLERVLYSTFAAEAGWLARRNLPFGVSLLALARPVDVAGQAPPRSPASGRLR